MKSVIPTLYVSDMEQSISFFDKALGFTLTGSLAGPDGSLAHASVVNGQVELMLGPVAALGAPVGGVPDVIMYMMTDDGADVDALFERAVNAGAKVIQQPQDQFWGIRDWTIADPDGHQFTVGKQVRDVSLEEMAEAAKSLAPVG